MSPLSVFTESYMVTWHRAWVHCLPFYQVMQDSKGYTTQIKTKVANKGLVNVFTLVQLM